ncbi:MAG: hypothetical protein J1E36_03840 [Eubacterium sp.]|nr:hypothetical protein [Eubacterium sp.]
MKKRISIFILSLICALSIPITVFAAEYGTEYPKYLNYSGGAYCEVQSSLGRGAFVVQDTYKTDYFGFVGTGYSLCNLSNTTITGRFVLQNGTVYQFRFSAFNTPEYYYESGLTREWRAVTITQIYNTNIEFIDNTELERDNNIDIFNNDSYKYVVVCLIILINLFLFLFTLAYFFER